MEGYAPLVIGTLSVCPVTRIRWGIGATSAAITGPIFCTPAVSSAEPDGNSAFSFILIISPSSVRTVLISSFRSFCSIYVSSCLLTVSICLFSAR